MKSKIQKSVILFTVAIFSMMVMVACGNTQAPQPTPNGDENIDPSPEVETRMVTIYYVNNEYVITGNEELESVLPVEIEVNIGGKTVEERVVEELQREPQDNNLTTELARLTIISVETVDDTVFVDFSSDGLEGGSLQESLVLTQLIYSLTELEGIDKVQILVEGNKVETLMGHIMIEEPLTR